MVESGIFANGVGVRMAQKRSDFTDRMTSFHQAIRASVAQRVRTVAPRGDAIPDEQPAYSQIHCAVPKWFIRRHEGGEERWALGTSVLPNSRIFAEFARCPD